MKHLRDGLDAEFNLRSAALKVTAVQRESLGCEFCGICNKDGLPLASLQLSQLDLQALVDLARDGGMVIR